MNISGTLNIFRLLRDPTLCLPQHTVSTFNHLPIPLSKVFSRKADNGETKQADIQAVVLDKDNCFAVPHANEVHQPYQDHFRRLRHAYPSSKLLIVSNTAGTSSDVGLKEAALLEANTGVKVLQHSTKKPGCKAEVMAYFQAHPDSGVTRPDQIAVVGDRLSTDVMMANMMGSYSIWVRDGVTGRGFVSSTHLPGHLPGWKIASKPSYYDGVIMHLTHRVIISLNELQHMVDAFTSRCAEFRELDLIDAIRNEGLEMESRGA